MHENSVINFSYELDAFRTPVNQGGYRTIALLEEFNEDIHMVATVEDDEVNIDWMGHASFSGIQLDRDEINRSLAVRGAMPLSGGQYSLLKSAYETACSTIFRNAIAEEESESGFYISENDRLFFYSSVSPTQWLRRAVERENSRYQGEFESEASNDGEPLTRQQIKNLSAVIESFPSPPSKYDDREVACVGKLSKSSPIEEYKWVALQICMYSPIGIKPSQALAIRELEGEDEVMEELGHKGGQRLLDQAQDKIRRSEWLVENFSN